MSQSSKPDTDGIPVGVMFVIGMGNHDMQAAPPDGPLSATTFPAAYLTVKTAAAFDAFTDLDDQMFRIVCRNDTSALVHGLRERTKCIQAEYDAKFEAFQLAALDFGTPDSESNYARALYAMDRIHHIKEDNDPLAAMVEKIAEFINANPGYCHYSVEEAMAAVRKQMNEARQKSQSTEAGTVATSDA